MTERCGEQNGKGSGKNGERMARETERRGHDEIVVYIFVPRHLHLGTTSI